MNIVEPKIFRLAETNLNTEGVVDFLNHQGVPDWATDTDSPAEWLVEIAGRRCYQSWETENKSASESNPNLTKVRTGNKEYLENILKSGHGAVIEHAYVTYAFEDVSRVFTHEIVRHRLCNFSQESLRFVRPTSLKAYFPEVFKSLHYPVSGEVRDLFEKTFIHLEDVQRQLVDLLGMDDTAKLFEDKKKLQSSMRRLMPIGMCTGIIVTANHRNWRHMIQMRTSKHCEEEMRKVFAMVAEDLHHSFPNLYQDQRVHKVSHQIGSPEYYYQYGRV